MTAVTIIGAGLAGSEAAWQLALQGIDVTLFEMRPEKMTPAHHTEQFAELVCSNSLGSNLPDNAAGLLKNELMACSSLILEAAQASKVPAGSALAVDRIAFAEYITQKITSHPRIHIRREEKTQLSTDDLTIVASGPLTSDGLTEFIQTLTGASNLFFFDAAAPIVSYESLNLNKIFRASRYDKGDQDYLNCPMTKDEYELFWHELVNAEVAIVRDFEKKHVFEGCMPIEVMAERGMQTLAFGPLRPVGLKHPVTGERPYAVVQLRQENSEGTLYNLVGFQTHLKWPEQKRVFQLIPGLEEAEFLRYGVMHRNTFLHAPSVLLPTMQMKRFPKVLFAGQITGVEGYVESVATGIIAAINAGKLLRNQNPVIFPEETILGALSQNITTKNISKNFQPINANMGILPPWSERIRDKRERNKLICQRAMEVFRTFALNNSIR